MLAALNIFPDPKYDPYLPTTHIATDRVWKTSTVLPMGGRITFERMACRSQSMSTESVDEYFIRININDGIVPLPDCDSGPGRSCPLAQFLERVRNRGTEVGDFGEVCGLEGDAGRITFLHQ